MSLSPIPRQPTHGAKMTKEFQIAVEDAMLVPNACMGGFVKQTQAVYLKPKE